MRLLAGAAVAGTDSDAGGRRLVAVPPAWLAETLKALRAPGWRRRRSRPGAEGHAAALPAGGRAVAASAVRARPRRLPRRRHGARQDHPGAGAAAGAAAGRHGTTQPSLLVAPASLLANWAAEIERFAPGLTAMIVHPSAMTRGADQAGHAGAGCGTRSGDHQLRLAAAHAGAGRDATGASSFSTRRRRSRTRTPSRPARPRSSRPRRASRSPARRSRTAWAICGRSSTSSIRACSGPRRQFAQLRQEAGRARAQPLRPAARAGAALHPAAAEDRQVRHRRPAGQDRGQGLLRPQPQAGGALRAGGDGSGRGAGGRRRHPAQGHRAGVADAPQADLQPSLAVAATTTPGPRRTAASWPACARSPRSSRRGRRRCWSSPSSAR